MALFDAIVPALYREASAQSAKEDASKFILSNDSPEVYSSLEIILFSNFQKMLSVVASFICQGDSVTFYVARKTSVQHGEAN